MKKNILIIFTFCIIIFSFLSLGRIKTEKELLLENELKLIKEKEERMNFKLNEINEVNYEFVKSTYVKDVDVNFVEIIHKKTNCHLVLMMCDDKNKSFCIAFSTYPYNNNGIAHIMEHSVMSGSRKYDTKDPFFELSKTSLATYMNAMTASDFTCFPCSSVNDKDFKNIMDVYLDAVFYPNIYTNKNIMRNQGWRYEIDDKGSLNVNGVVLNEMKGDNNSAISCLANNIYKDMFNGTSYQYMYGGETKEIVSLTNEEFLEFHKKYYVPSNAQIYLYGLIDYNERLEYLNDEYLSNFDKVEVDLPKYKYDDLDSVDGVHYYQSDEDEKNKSFISYNIMLKDDMSTFNNLVDMIIGYILFNKEGALIREKLIKLGYGEDIFFEYTRSNQFPFINIVAENIDPIKKDDFVKTINNSIDELLDKGIDSKYIESTLQMAYMDYLDKSAGSTSLGISYSLNLLKSYRYGYPIETYFGEEKYYEKLIKEDYKNKDNVIVKRIKEIFKGDLKKCVTIVSPKNNVLKEEEEQLKDILYLRKKDMQKNNSEYSLEECKKDIKEFNEWLKKEDTDDELMKIPQLKVSDIERNIQLIDIEKDELYNKELYKSYQNTELVALGINYYLPKKDEVFDDKEKFLLAIAVKLLGSLNTENYSYDELNTIMDGVCSGVVFTINVNEKSPFLHIYAKTMKEYMKKTYDLMNEILYKTKFDDKERIKQKLIEFSIGSKHSLNSDVSMAPKTRSSIKYSYRENLNEVMSIGTFTFDGGINELLKVYDVKYEEINKSFKYVLNKYLDYNKMFIDCCLSEENFDEYCDETKDFLKNSVIFNGEKEKINVDINSLINLDEYKRNFTMEAFVGNRNVNIVARTYRFDENKYNGSFNVFTNIVNYDYMISKLRDEGGAYGAAMMVNKNGYFTLYTHSDPNLVETDKIFKNIFDYMKNNKTSDVNFENSKIGSIKTIDVYPLFYTKHLNNLTSIVFGDTNELINKRRNEILDTKLSDFQNFANVLSEYNNESEFCAIISPSFEKEAKEIYKIVKRIK